MKQLIKNYSFSTLTKDVTFTDFTAIRLERILFIEDVTTNQTLYSFNDPSVATGTVSSNVLTLSQIPLGVNNTDALMIIYDCAAGDPLYDTSPSLAVGTSGSPLPAHGMLAQGADGLVALNMTVDANGNQQMVGNVASAAADSGNPVKVGGVYHASIPTFADGQRGDLQMSSNGVLFASLKSGTNTINAGTSQSDGNTNSLTGLWVFNYPSFYNGSNWDRQRTPNIFKTATGTVSGNTAIWTPTSGKKFRIMRVMLEVTANVSITSGGLLEITLQDATTPTNIAALSLYAPSAAATNAGVIRTPWVELQNGYLSSAANNVLNMNLSAALVTGEARCVVCGTEE